ncbi:ankyrin repeat domain-containing protein 16-like [Xenia sp. Carnegie-2017]|uniref:ankyrin repeat domain-containing protein 16-like n=1 Tax=Xenia sp. Carnegie-2017 TaxID=2897299 RepID=UPI001F047E8E|nr:ankyrin repeat domain-containing protein 16-like [Xenia sp. Carnegie-2017]
MFPLHRAAIEGHVDCLKYFINKSCFFTNCGTSLLLACCNERHEVIEFLLNMGVSVTARSIMMDTCLHISVKRGDVWTVKLLMENYSEDLLELRDRHERTALHLAASNGSSEVMKILLSFHSNVLAIDDCGKNPLHVAAESDSLDCARLLIEAERDCVNYTDFLGRTSLHLAAVRSKDERFIKLLLENGADVNARDDSRWTPLLHVAFKGCPMASGLLIDYGAKPNEWDKNRMTALSIAASRNKSVVVKVLLEKGVDPSIRNSEGQSSMDIALNERYHDVCMVIAKSEKWREALASSKTMQKCLDVSPEVAKVILDKCIEYNGREIDKNYKVTYHFDLLDPHPDEKNDYYGPQVMKKARRNDLLIHPLTKKLLQVNWQHGVRYCYYSEMCLLAVVMILLTFFMVNLRKLIADCYLSSIKQNISDAFFTDDEFCSDKFVSFWHLYYNVLGGVVDVDSGPFTRSDLSNPKRRIV